MDIPTADLSSDTAGAGLDPAARAGYSDHPPRMGFFTDTSVCIGCKACEVACKEWNAVPEDGLLLTGMSYDNTAGLSASTWRHVAFIEKPAADEGHNLRWLMSSDVCKHCTEAACLDVCPTGALMRTEFGTVVVQDDVCNGCGYCVSACPFGVIARRESDGGAHKCTLCYDRIGDGLTPACAKACPTESIQFGPLDELRERAQLRVNRNTKTGRSFVSIDCDPSGVQISRYFCSSRRGRNGRMNPYSSGNQSARDNATPSPSNSAAMASRRATRCSNVMAFIRHARARPADCARPTEPRRRERRDRTPSIR